MLLFLEFFCYVVYLWLKFMMFLIRFKHTIILFHFVAVYCYNDNKLFLFGIFNAQRAFDR